MLKCKICGKYFKHLGSHVWHKHRMLARDYKRRFGLNYNHPLITSKIQEKMRDAFWNNPKGLKNLKKGRKYRFKKGVHKVQGYISAEKKRQIYLNLLKINKRKRWERCPICGIKYKHLASHLYNKHKLLKVK